MTDLKWFMASVKDSIFFSKRKSKYTAKTNGKPKLPTAVIISSNDISKPSPILIVLSNSICFPKTPKITKIEYI